jgi:hypothetical protein
MTKRAEFRFVDDQDPNGRKAPLCSAVRVSLAAGLPRTK